MRILLVTSLVPCGAPESGYEIANASIAASLRAAGATVKHLGFQWPGSRLSEPGVTVSLGELDVKTDRATTRQKLAWLAQAIGAGVPFASAKLLAVDAVRLAGAMDAAGPTDAIVLNGVTMAGAHERLLTRRPYGFIAHNVEHESAGEAARHAEGVAERLMYRREARLLQRLETRLIGDARHVVALTQEDLDAFGLANSPRATVMPLVMPNPTTPSANRMPAFDAGMIGTWTWAPNRIGLEWFLQEVMPLLPADFAVAIAGSLPAGFPKRDGRVSFLGRVISSGDFLRQCRIVALTARAGTGVQLKTLEALEAGLPTVATPSSLRGISERPDNVAIAETPQDFAAALLAMASSHKAGAVKDRDGTLFRANQEKAAIVAAERLITALLPVAG